MKTQEIQFEGSHGHQLAARVDLPDEDGKLKAWCLFAHCFTCSMNYKAVVNVARALTNHGMGVFRFDFTGLGQSEGDFSETNFSSNVEDVAKAAGHMKAHYESPTILIGHSLGGTAMVQAARKIDSSRAVATIGSPYSPEHVIQLLDRDVERIEKQGEAIVTIGGRKFKLKKHFIDDLRQDNFREEIGKLGRALLIFHSPVDNVVGIDNAAEIFMAAKHPKSFISLDQAGHLLPDEKDSCYVGALIAEWAERYLD